MGIGELVVLGLEELEGLVELITLDESEGLETEELDE